MSIYTARIKKKSKTMFCEDFVDLNEAVNVLLWQLENILENALISGKFNGDFLVYYESYCHGDFSFLESLFDSLTGISWKDFKDINDFCSFFNIHVSISKR